MYLAICAHANELYSAYRLGEQWIVKCNIINDRSGVNQIVTFASERFFFSVQTPMELPSTSKKKKSILKNCRLLFRWIAKYQNRVLPGLKKTCTLTCISSQGLPSLQRLRVRRPRPPDSGRQTHTTFTDCTISVPLRATGFTMPYPRTLLGSGFRHSSFWTPKSLADSQRARTMCCPRGRTEITPSQLVSRQLRHWIHTRPTETLSWVGIRGTLSFHGQSDSGYLPFAHTRPTSFKALLGLEIYHRHVYLRQASITKRPISHYPGRVGSPDHPSPLFCSPFSSIIRVASGVQYNEGSRRFSDGVWMGNFLKEI